MVAILEIGAFSEFFSSFQHVQFIKIAPNLRMFLIPTLVTSLLAGRIGDIYGRRVTLFLGATIFTIGGALQTFTTGFTMMVFGRIISGFGVGFLS